MEKETRTINSSVEVRSVGKDGDSVKITGYGAVFDELSEPMCGFREKISHGAFDEVLNDDVKGLFNHDPNFVLGRNGSTMRLSVDEKGLRYEIDAPNTQTIRDLVIEPMKRGDINQSSFAFTVEDDEWTEEDDGMILRTIKKVKRLLDVSPVTYPAYTVATSTARSLDELRTKSENKEDSIELRKAEHARWKARVDRTLKTL